MNKSFRLGILALLMLFAVHLHPVYRVTAGTERLAGLYTASQIRVAREAAQAAAEELLGGGAALPPLRRSLRLRLLSANGQTPLITDALLRGTEGVVSADAVLVNGRQLGTVADGKTLVDALQQTIRDRLPAGAVAGNLSGRLQIGRVYSREGLQSENTDMLARILDAAPVFYLDGSGKRI